MLRNQILVYGEDNDPTVPLQTLRDYFHCTLYDVRTVTARDIVERDALGQRTLAFFLPGANKGSRYADKLAGDGNKKVREFVENGGTFVGICAGAYYACEKIEWAFDNPAEKIDRSPGLDLIAGIARGPHRHLVAPNGTHVDWTGAGVTTVIHSIRNGSFQTSSVLYWGGPALRIDENDPDTTVLARFAAVPDHPPAIVRRKVGRGQALALGVHPEYSGSRILNHIQKSPDLWPEATHSRGRDIGCKLMENDDSRRKLWNIVMNRIAP